MAEEEVICIKFVHKRVLNFSRINADFAVLFLSCFILQIFIIVFKDFVIGREMRTGLPRLDALQKSAFVVGASHSNLRRKKCNLKSLAKSFQTRKKYEPCNKLDCRLGRSRRPTCTWRRSSCRSHWSCGPPRRTWTRPCCPSWRRGQGRWNPVWDISGKITQFLFQFSLRMADLGLSAGS